MTRTPDPAVQALDEDGPQTYDDAVERVHRAFCDPAHELVGPWDEEMANALRRNGYLIVKAERHHYEGDGGPCIEPCGGPEQGDPRHFTDGDA
jgi:hypothetical protein